MCIEMLLLFVVICGESRLCSLVVVELLFIDNWMVCVNLVCVWVMFMIDLVVMCMLLVNMLW